MSACECLGFVHDDRFRLVCVDCGTALEDVEEDPVPQPKAHPAAFGSFDRN